MPTHKDSWPLVSVRMAYFLIAHSQKNEQPAPLAAQLKEKFPDKKIGVNYLGYRVPQAFETAQTRGLDMLWLDAPGIHSSCVDEQAVYLSGRLQGTSLEIFALVLWGQAPEVAKQIGTEGKTFHTIFDSYVTGLEKGFARETPVW